jgi:uncharacterized protein (DUF1501 family)
MAWDASRRVFLKGAGMAALGVGMGPTPLMMRAAEASGAGGEVLVHIFFRGGFDGLNFLSPYADPEYQNARPGIALRRDDADMQRRAIALDSYFGINASLAPLETLYRAGIFGFVPAVGNLKLTRSHFDAQDFIEQGTPGNKTTPDGWIGRAVKQIPGAAVTDQVAFASQRPRSFFGSEPVLVASNLSSFNLRAGSGNRIWRPDADRILRSMYQSATSPEMARAGQETFSAIDVLVRQTLPNPSNGAVYPTAAGIGPSLRQAAQLIKAGIGTRTIFINVGGRFDTHANQLNANALDYVPIGQALAAFAQDLGSMLDNVFVLGLTEFGRTFTQNGSLGTDHGTGSVAFYMGGRARGGRILGRWPGLAKSQLNEQRDLMPTTDFRDLFAEVLQKHMGVTDTSTVLPGHTPSAVGML